MPRSEPPRANEPRELELRRELERQQALGEHLRDLNDELMDAQGLLEQARDDYAELYDMAPLPLITLSPNSFIRSANLAAAELLEHERSRLIGRPFRSFIRSSDRTRAGAWISDEGQRDAPSCEVRLALPSGASIPIELCTRRSTRVLGMLHVTLLDLRDRERESVERQQLIEAERSAREANASKDKFIAMLSHELRTPLTPVLAAASTLRSAPELGEDVREVFSMIQRNISAEARLIDDLLDATGISHGKVSVVQQPVDVQALAAECIEALRPELEAKRLKIGFDAGAERGFTDGDPLRLRQVFTNVLKNALKFTPQGGEVQLRSWNHASVLRIEVRDTGRGFSPEDAPRLFAAFDQLDRPGTPGGLGLGLAISKGLLELHGGAISATSLGPDRGARFVIELPASAAPNVAPPLIATPKALPPAPPPLGRYRILLVEDHEDTAEILAALLEEYGYGVVTAGSVQAALAIDINAVDAIVSDIGLPDGTGMDLMRALRTKSETPAIALSGFGMESDVQSAKQAGFDRHLTKPVEIDRLLAALGELLKSDGAALVAH